MSAKPTVKTSLIAPCGMNCGVCMVYLREKNQCPGCRAADTGKPKTRTKCKIKKCPTLIKQGYKYCFSCAGMPCERLEHLDKRYRAKYNMSMIENLASIARAGVRQFVINESKRWKCPACGGVICVHKGRCSSCGKEI